MNYISIYDLFKAAWLGLKAQGFVRSMSKDFGHCRYRGDGGCKCAIGHFIPDEAYSEDMECKSGVSVLALLGYIPGEDERTMATMERKLFIRQLQISHDEGKIPEEMERNLRALATFNFISIEKVENDAQG